MNYQAFLSVISLIAAAYAFFTRQAKLGLGLIIYTIVFFLLIPNIAFGIKADFISAIAMVLFVAGSFVIVWKKKKAEVTKEDEEIKSNPM
jgi:CHASE2 domain-containing sensor protein